MKKEKAKKEKISKKSGKGAPLEQQGLLDLVSAMTKIAERLGGIENKLEQVIRQTAAISSTMAQVGQHVPRVEPSHNGHEHRADHPNSNQNPPQNNHRHDRIMYKAVCADCRKDCEVPFKPTGERPVYCKECFAKRKANSQGKTTIEIPMGEPDPVRVMPKVTDKVAASGNGSASLKSKSKKPVKKSKR